MRIALFGIEAEVKDVVSLAERLVGLRLAQGRLLVTLDGSFVHVEIDVDGSHGNDGRHNWRDSCGGHRRAFLEIRLADFARQRGDDLRVFQIEFDSVGIGILRLDLRLVRVFVRDRLFQLLLRHCVGLDQFLVPFDDVRRRHLLGCQGRALRLDLRQLGAEGVGINVEQRRLAFFHHVAVLEIDLGDVAAHARADIDGLKRLQPAVVVVVVGEAARDGMDDGDLGRLLALGGRGGVVAASGGQH